nr:uncharacterized protein LOC129384067 [Dermacentor andersoni]
MELPDCSLCQDRMDTFVTTACGHLYHFECLQSWLQTSASCPLCRKPVDLKDVIKLHGPTSCQAGEMCATQLKNENTALKRQLSVAEHRASKNAKVALEKTAQAHETMAKLADKEAQVAYWSTTARLSHNLRRDAIATIRRIASTYATSPDAEVDRHEATGVLPGDQSPSAPVLPGDQSPPAPELHGDQSLSASVLPGDQSPSAPELHGDESPSASVLPGDQSPPAPELHGDESPSY